LDKPFGKNGRKMNTKKKNLQYYNLAGTEEDDGKDGISM
jgi:hypothetical protein